MQKKLLLMKKNLLKKISRKDYDKACSYVEDIYLAEYDLKILMARKFSNYFFTMFPIVKEDDGGRVKYSFLKKFSDKEAYPEIISNRALALYEKKIKSGKYLRILLADDVIIHGRTLSQIYDQLKLWFEEAGISDYKIDVWAYAESKQGIIKSEAMKKRKVVSSCSNDEWRRITDQIVETLYLTGQPYTSYVPNMQVQMDSVLGCRIQEMLQDENSGFSLQTTEEMRSCGVESYVYVGENPYHMALNCSMRIYKYSAIGFFVIVPMIMLKPVTGEVLYTYKSELKEAMRNIWNLPQSELAEADKTTYMLVVYVLSALWGWRFIYDRILNCVQDPESMEQIENEMQYDAQEEKVNFSEHVLIEGFEKKINAEKWSDLIQKANRRYVSVPDIEEVWEKEEDIQRLNEHYMDILKKIQHTDATGEVDGRIYFGRVLCENARMDEESCISSYNNKSNSDDLNAAAKHYRKRLTGYPMAKIAAELGRVISDWMKAIIYAIDYGKGSIVPACIEKEGIWYYFSVIHAGEQNYKYYIERYFPIMYGMYCIEAAGEDNQWKEEYILEKKDLFEKKFSAMKNINGSFEREDLDEIRKLSVNKEYGEVLVYTARRYMDDKELNRAIGMAKEIIEKA